MCPLYLLLSILIKVCEGTVSSVVGIDGRNVTLPCRYDVRTHGALQICWGRGEVPRSKCSKPVISSWDGNVDFRLSPRYQLLGKAREGDMSLTILHAQTSDSGMYGCRVEIPGWFNDLKFNIHLVIEEEPVEQTSFPLETQSVTQDYILPTEDSQEMLTETPAFETLGTENPLMTVTPEVLRASKERFKAFLEIGNIGRMTTIFSTTIIIILVIMFRRRNVRVETPAHAENIYESIEMPARSADR